MTAPTDQPPRTPAEALALAVAMLDEQADAHEAASGKLLAGRLERVRATTTRHAAALVRDLARRHGLAPPET